MIGSVRQRNAAVCRGIIMENKYGKLSDNQSLISVIVPVHNGEAYLKNCIESIENQTWEPLEVIIVEDGSVDRTAQICLELEKSYENIIVVHMDDRGVSAGRNAGLLRARGEYVTFVDADDRLHPQMIERLCQSLIETGSDVSGCRFFSWQTQQEWERGIQGSTLEGERSAREEEECAHREEKAATGKQNPRPAEGDEEGRRIFSQKEFALKGILSHDTRCWSKLFKRECLQKVRFREGLTIGEDMLFLVDALPYIGRAVSIDFAGYGYFYNPQGAMNRQFCPSYMDQIACWELAEEKLSGWAAGQMLNAQEAAWMAETLAARRMTGIMLTVGKLAMLDKKGRRENRNYVKSCQEKLRSCLRTGKGMAYLETGYRYKVRLFSKMPGLYVWLYGNGKRLKGRGRNGGAGVAFAGEEGA